MVKSLRWVHLHVALRASVDSHSTVRGFYMFGAVSFILIVHSPLNLYPVRHLVLGELVGICVISWLTVGLRNE